MFKEVWKKLGLAMILFILPSIGIGQAQDGFDYFIEEVSPDEGAPGEEIFMLTTGEDLICRMYDSSGNRHNQ